jgi:hypothetical protein
MPQRKQPFPPRPPPIAAVAAAAAAAAAEATTTARDGRGRLGIDEAGEAVLGAAPVVRVAEPAVLVLLRVLLYVFGPGFGESVVGGQGGIRIEATTTTTNGTRPVW